MSCNPYLLALVYVIGLLLLTHLLVTVACIWTWKKILFLTIFYLFLALDGRIPFLPSLSPLSIISPTIESSHSRPDAATPPAYFPKSPSLFRLQISLGLTTLFLLKTRKSISMARKIVPQASRFTQIVTSSATTGADDPMLLLFPTLENPLSLSHCFALFSCTSLWALDSVLQVLKCLLGLDDFEILSHLFYPTNKLTLKLKFGLL